MQAICALYKAGAKVFRILSFESQRQPQNFYFQPKILLRIQVREVILDYLFIQHL
jgi:hypothetical protein